MVTAWKDRDYSSRYHQSILKGYNRQRSAVFLSGSRLSSRHIFHTHRYLKPFQIKIFFHLMSSDRIGTFAPCQSGVWHLLNAEQGTYASLGSFKGIYSGRNSSGKHLRLYVRGGNPPPRKINSGNADDCVNTFSLVASVDGYTVASSVTGNSEWGKIGSIVFDVPERSSFSVVSNGMMAYGCDYGNFTVISYQ
ncbi:hypothetical protein NOH45_002737 [Salmonella enterica]|nr:hypothetical protein [Salmonella enterica]